jgi:predicted enzyme related to lactoylglutathione lyase
MANIEKHTPGSFCWVELATTDQQAAKNFYGKLFGWQAEDTPMSPNDFYTTFKINGRDVAAAYTMRPEQQSSGMPPNWLLYVSVQDVNESLSKAGRLGANILVEGLDVAELGRLGILQDPTGAMIALWQAKSHSGTGVIGENGTLCWADLSTPDPQAAARFYSELFGWKIEQSSFDPSDYLHIRNGEHHIGGIPPARYRTQGSPPHWLAYFEIANCDAITDQAKQLGARPYMEPMTMENVGRWSVLADPQGAVFAAFQTVPQQQIKAS